MSGVVSGGQTVNTVAPWAKGEIDLRFITPADRDDAMAQDRGDHGEELSCPAPAPSSRSPANSCRWSRAPDGKALFEHYAACAEGSRPRPRSTALFTGGCADSGFTAAAGTPTICAVGPVGGKAHTPDEYLEIDTLVPRAQALALAVLRLP